MKLVLLLTIVWCGLIVFACTKCASNADRSKRNMRRNRLRKFLAISKAIH